MLINVAPVNLWQKPKFLNCSKKQNMVLCVVCPTLQDPWFACDFRVQRTELCVDADIRNNIFIADTNFAQARIVYNPDDMGN